MFDIWSADGRNVWGIRGGFCFVLSRRPRAERCDQEMLKGLGNGNLRAHKEQSKIPEESLENSSAPSVPRPSHRFRSRDVNGNNYYIWLLVLFWDFFFPVSARPLIYLISIVLGSWPFLEYLLVILIFYIYIYVCVNIYIYIRNVLHLLTDKVVYIILTVNDLQRLLSKIFFHESFPPPPKISLTFLEWLQWV